MYEKLNLETTGNFMEIELFFFLITLCQQFFRFTLVSGLVAYGLEKNVLCS